LFIPKKQEINFVSGYSSSKATSYAILDSLTMAEEMMALEFTPQEEADWHALQALVHSNQPLTRETFDTLRIEFFEEENLLLTLLYGVVRAYSTAYCKVRRALRNWRSTTMAKPPIMVAQVMRLSISM
jgi:hypothetical protein